MDAGKPPVYPDAHAHEDIAAEGLDQGCTVTGRGRRPGGYDLARRQPTQELRKHPEALGDLIHAHQQTRIDVAFIGFIRDELKFDGVDALIRQMDDDSARARAVLAAAPDAFPKLGVIG
jgi:hypothetical protein